ncbi:MAG TPA: dihydrodipicolinate synthase family protein [Pyrinomonadaceae bacterium]|jgi:4-hydroxy-2-oxoglutarate aldolase|nr:dihydrodipicolinate synthase family protein [Pyrinomonadaceae bacterium]
MTTAVLPLENLRKVLLPITTPFSSEFIDLDALRVNLERWTTAGICGYVVLGSTGERVHLDESEYLRVIEAARERVSTDHAFIAGAGQQSTRGTINEIAKAAAAGADAVLVITPSYYRSAITQDTLIAYYKTVADAAPVPVLLYSMPALTGIKIEPETVARLSEHPNIIGVKDSSNDIAEFKRTVELCPTEFAVMTGNGTVFLDALEAGATGAILAVGCVVPELCVEIFRLFNSGELDRARTLQQKLTPLAAAVTTRFGIGGLKAALDLASYRGGEVRAPLQPPNESARVEIAKLLDDARLSLSA